MLPMRLPRPLRNLFYDSNMAVRPTATAEDITLLDSAGIPNISLADACDGCEDPCQGDTKDSVFNSLDVP